MDLFINTGALFTPSNKHRIVLWRIWDIEKPTILFIGLNPSTANEVSDDPTIRRVRRFATDWGFGGIYMMNCYTLVSSNPDDLRNSEVKWVQSLHKIQNDVYLKSYAKLCEKIVFAWGSFSIVKEYGRDVELSKMFPDAYCLGKNANGSPKHPLYLKADTKLEKY
jgi:hypothetical protein